MTEAKDKERVSVGGRNINNSRLADYASLITDVQHKWQRFCHALMEDSEREGLRIKA
jgi:hypothetical protein